MAFWVARNRQKAPENNAFAERARRKRTRNPNPEPEETAPEAVSAPDRTPEPVEVADSMPDLQALREAAQQVSEMIHADRVAEATPEPEAPRRGRQPDPAVQERHARVLALVQEAGQEGTTKPKLAEDLEEKEQQVYTSLRALQKDGKVESKYLDGLGYRWIAV